MGKKNKTKGFANGNSGKDNHQMVKDYAEFVSDDRIDKRAAVALGFLYRYGSIDGEHHKTWVLDQIFRTLAGEHYKTLSKSEEKDYGKWDTGIAP